MSVKAGQNPSRLRQYDTTMERGWLNRRLVFLDGEGQEVLDVSIRWPRLP